MRGKKRESKGEIDEWEVLCDSTRTQDNCVGVMPDAPVPPSDG